MSLFKENLNGFQGTLASDILRALAESPELIKDEGFKHAGQQAGLDVYHKLLESTGVPPQDIDLKVNENAERLKTHPRRETVVFIRVMQALVADDSQA